MIVVDGTCVGLAAADGKRRGVLLRGPPGAGKSDLALRLIDRGAMLVADDRVELHPAQGRLTASSPAPIAGLIEVRGLGLVKVPVAERVPLALAVDLVPQDAVERMPDPATADVAGLEIALIRLCPFEPSVAIKVELALMRALSGAAMGDAP